jgi:hypothetical protein
MADMIAADRAGDKPSLEIETYFAGKTRAWGIFQDRFGKLRRQFTVDILGRRDGADFVLDEDFVYGDGTTERRVWRIRSLGLGRYEGRSEDVIGVASGSVTGNVLNWRYAMRLKVSARTLRVFFDDWMFLLPDGVLLNRARVSKWGVRLGEVTLAFRKL